MPATASRSIEDVSQRKLEQPAGEHFNKKNHTTMDMVFLPIERISPVRDTALRKTREKICIRRYDYPNKILISAEQGRKKRFACYAKQEPGRARQRSVNNHSECCEKVSCEHVPHGDEQIS